MYQEVQRHGVCCILVLATDRAIRARIAKAGGIAATITAMVSHAGDATVQRYACAFLVSLAANDSRNREGIAAEGGIPVVVAAMVAHPRSRSVQKKGCHALVNIMSNCDRNRAAVAKVGGCAAVAAVLREHRDAGVLAQATSAMLSLSADRDLAKRCISEGAVLGVAGAMSAFPESAEVLSNGCGCLVNFANYSTATERLRIASEGGVKAVVKAMAAAPANRNVQVLSPENCPFLAWCLCGLHAPRRPGYFEI